MSLDFIVGKLIPKGGDGTWFYDSGNGVKTITKLAHINVYSARNGARSALVKWDHYTKSYTINCIPISRLDFDDIRELLIAFFSLCPGFNYGEMDNSGFLVEVVDDILVFITKGNLNLRDIPRDLGSFGYAVFKDAEGFKKFYTTPKGKSMKMTSLAVKILRTIGKKIV